MDTSAIAERLSASMAAVANPEPTSTPDPTPAAVAASSIPDVTPSTPTTPEPESTPTHDITFEDDPEPLKFDDDEPEATPVAEATPAVDPAEEGFQGALDKRVESEFLKTNRGKRLLATFKDSRTLESAPDYDPETGENRGGLGFVPHAAQVKEWHSAQSDLEAMEHEFSANPKSFLTNWLLPDGNYREGADQVLGSIPDMLNATYVQAMQSGNQQLAQRTEQAYGQIFRPMAAQWLNGIYEQAKQEQNKDRKEWLGNVARGLDFILNNGTFRPDQELAAPTPQDQLTQREQQLAAREQEIRTWNQKNQTKVAETARQSTIQNINQSLDKDALKAFKTAEQHVKPAVLQAYVNQFKADMHASLYRNQQVNRDFNWAVSKIRGPQDADNIAKARAVYTNAARAWIQANYRSRLKDLVDDTVAKNAAAHSTAESGASRVAPGSGNGHAAAQSIVPVNQIKPRQPGEDMVDYMTRRNKVLMSQVQ